MIGGTTAMVGHWEGHGITLKPGRYIELKLKEKWKKLEEKKIELCGSKQFIEDVNVIKTNIIE